MHKLRAVLAIGVVCGSGLAANGDGSSWFDNQKLNLLDWRNAYPHEVDGWAIPAFMSCPRILILRSRYYDKKIIPEDVLKLDYDVDPLWPAEWPDSIKAPGFIFTIFFAPYREMPKVVDNLELSGEWGEYCRGIAKFIAYGQPVLILLDALKSGFGGYIFQVIVSESVSYMCCLVFYSVGWYFTPSFVMQLLVSWRLLVLVVIFPLTVMSNLFSHAQKPPILRRQSSSDRATQALIRGLLH